MGNVVDKRVLCLETSPKPRGDTSNILLSPVTGRRSKSLDRLDRENIHSRAPLQEVKIEPQQRRTETSLLSECTAAGDAEAPFQCNQIEKSIARDQVGPLNLGSYQTRSPRRFNSPCRDPAEPDPGLCRAYP